MATREEIQELNVGFFEQLDSRDPELIKNAVDAVTDFTRTKMREQGFLRRIMPPIPISNGDLVRQMDTDKPVMIIDKEPNSPAAVTVGFGTLPNSLWIKGDRYKIGFCRLLTPRYTKDVAELRTWIMDIRQVLSDNALKDLLAEEDSSWLSAVNSALVGQGTTVPTSGVAQWQKFPGGFSRENLFEANKLIRNTPFNLKEHTALINHVSILDVCKFGRNEQGGDSAEEIMLNGWTLSKYMGIDWIITIKKTLVPNGTVYYFSDPAFIGKFYEQEPVTMYVRREAYFLEFFAYEEIGLGIGHTAGLGRADFTT